MPICPPKNYEFIQCQGVRINSGDVAAGILFWRGVELERFASRLLGLRNYDKM
jgi:hypothetical protein